MYQAPKGYILLKEPEYLALLKQIEFLTERVKVLEARLNQNSNNSSKPPSTDGYKKEAKKNNRESSGRKPGAQQGHPGSGLVPFTQIDKTIECKVAGKCSCGADLDRQPSTNIEKRQVIDLPEKLYEVSEYHIEVKQCVCGQIHKAPCGYPQRVQYGERLKAFLVYMNAYQQIPCERLQELVSDIVGLSISDGLIQSSTERCSENMDQPLEQITEAVLKSGVLHADETGVRCEKKTSWLHSLSTMMFTLYYFHVKRGHEAMNDMGILPYYDGILVHDRWASYDKYDCSHALCNSHLLRELKYLHEEMNRAWAEKLKILLQRANERKTEGAITPHFRTRIRNQIEEIVCAALKKEPKPVYEQGKRGKKPKGKAVCLLEVFRERLDDILRFMYVKDVPFDNNQAERDIRMMKLKQKISGCFRTKQGIANFCRIRSYISTVKKQNKNVWNAITQAIQGYPVDLLVFD
jgi:transposase